MSGLRINSSVPSSQIEISETTPRDRATQIKYCYYCPICLRYFTRILVSDCCKNYLCLFCARDINQRKPLTSGPSGQRTERILQGFYLARIVDMSVH